MRNPFRNEQKHYFKIRTKAMQRKIWDLEFDRFKFEEIREEVREEYDRKSSRLKVIETQLLNEKDEPTMSKDELGRLEDEKTIIQRDLERHLAQMADCDAQIQGVAPTAENPGGVQGINEQLDIFREYIEMLKAYRKQL